MGEAFDPRAFCQDCGYPTVAGSRPRCPECGRLHRAPEPSSARQDRAAECGIWCALLTYLLSYTAVVLLLLHIATDAGPPGPSPLTRMAMTIMPVSCGGSSCPGTAVRIGPARPSSPREGLSLPVASRRPGPCPGPDHRQR